MTSSTSLKKSNQIEERNIFGQKYGSELHEKTILNYNQVWFLILFTYFQTHFFSVPEGVEVKSSLFVSKCRATCWKLPAAESSFLSKPPNLYFCVPWTAILGTTAGTTFSGSWLYLALVTAAGTDPLQVLRTAEGGSPKNATAPRSPPRCPGQIWQNRPC